jgi:hypothetical protein
MGNRLRKVLAFVTIMAVAVAGVLPAHQAMAASHPQPVAQTVAVHGIVDCHHQDAALRGSHHDVGGGHHGAHHDATLPEHDRGTASDDTTAPDYACCATACAAIAFIFSTFSFDHLTISEIFDRPLTQILRPAAAATVDPPPRMG